MEDSLKEISTPGPYDNLAKSKTPCMDKDILMDTLTEQTIRNPPLSPGHQGAKTGVKSVNENFKVVYTPFVDLDCNYKSLYEIAQEFGEIKRMKLKISTNEQYFSSYIIYESATSAQEAYNHAKNEEGDIPPSRQSKLMDERNIKDEDGDFIPKIPDIKNKTINRKMLTPIWHIASYKEGESNMFKAWESIEEHVGTIPEKNIKRYGKNLLVKAAHNTQANLLTSFKNQNNTVIESITPHKSYNTARGVIYSKDLYEFTEE